ncbi:helicase-domain-containing protein [Suillus ampliporus]|nr:helicase-domain-containing protein [Suillus ampliporus]
MTKLSLMVHLRPVVRCSLQLEVHMHLSTLEYTPAYTKNSNLLTLVAGVLRFQSINSQKLLTSSIGDALYSIYSSTSSTPNGNSLGSQTQIYQELFLRSGFMVVGSFPDNIIPDNLSSPVNGTMYISTTWNDRQTSRHRITFDVSNTLHLITMRHFAHILTDSQYIQPEDAHVLGQAELVVIDEAAAIPLPLVRNLLGPYLVFMASTINGYEGTGRSLSLKLIQRLHESTLTFTHKRCCYCLNLQKAHTFHCP